MQFNEKFVQYNNSIRDTLKNSIFLDKMKCIDIPIKQLCIILKDTNNFSDNLLKLNLIKIEILST